MSKLSTSLKALINAPFAKPGPRPAPKQVQELYEAIANDAAIRNLGPKSWLTVSAAATFTLNSPDSLPVLHRVAFNGIPRTINSLNAFHASLPEEVTSKLCTKPSRQPTSQNIDEALARGRGLWDSIYRPYEDKLFEKLALAHPDLPVYILSSHYSALLSDPPASQRDTLASLGRVHTSMIAISCLRAQTGVGPQVLSHVFGLRKALEDGTYKNDQDGESEEAVQYLASDEGGHWILNTVDKIVEAIGGSSFAPGRDSKL
ncbi:Dol-P-Man:Man(5)GlcNAc(2)-PP-Dol alpha-1,3-mannosyltransferase [Fusarium odoratissimum]|uniref:Dol-P-Man:Man(5)GlcNAc(2)-PP-Dol alpha-1,3-mannosyltransferase n=1 Tax=Fusarium oxysporum f. sp. cubense (strain race 4) TaxID=2502994 RepID=N1SAX6_FUSC4|nr:Dol-P-Man:Man(5)GlcNAc(2)-PP-Dol alpha-1,3-mannosyltransferase [Fusarium odoratissimum]